jgi:hypothetical protein
MFDVGRSTSEDLLAEIQMILENMLGIEENEPKNISKEMKFRENDTLKKYIINLNY